LERIKLQQLIKRYEDVYLFATKKISSLISEQVLEDLSLEQFSILRQLYLKEELRSSELAEFFGVNKSAITTKVERLVQRGFVERRRDEKDRRNVFLSLTHSGKALYINVQLQIEEFIFDYLKELTEEELETFVNLYEKISKIIEKKSRGDL